MSETTTRTLISIRFGGLALAGAIVLLLASLAGGDRGATAATPVFVDGAGACNGSLPCFTTIQAGVNNAGPAPAQVFIFPGSYTEDVDLSLMGSAIAGSPGTITLTTVNASGAAQDGTVTLTADVGHGIFNSVEPFPGSVTLEGIDVTSPNANGIDLVLDAGDVILDGIQANSSLQRGVEIDSATGDVDILGSEADGNGDDGFNVTTQGAVSVITVTDSSADGNDGAGIEVSAAGGAVTIGDAHASGNEVGFEIDGTSVSITILGSSANNNVDEGFQLDGVTGATSFATLSRVESDGNGDDGVDTGGMSVELTCSLITNNGDIGVLVEDASPADSAVNYNNITGNLFGIEAQFATLDAENNWWGDASGPSGAGPGSGDPANAPVDFTPFLATPAGEPCPPAAPTATPTRTPPSSGGGGNSIGASTPTSTGTPAPPAAEATATAQRGDAGAGVIAPPDTGAGPGRQDAPWLMLLASMCLAAGSAAAAAGARLLVRRGGQR